MEQMILKAAKAAKRDGKPYFIFPTAYRWNICPRKPAFNQQYTQVAPTGEATYHDYDFVNQAWSVRTIGTV